MPKTTYILAVMLCSLFSYGQEITFYKNVNYRASSLQQNLNTESDVLLLESTKGQITKVEIFNEDYSESFNVNSYETNIDLKPLPSGNFVIQAKVENQWIIMYLEKTEALIHADSDYKKKSEALGLRSNKRQIKAQNAEFSSNQEKIKTLKNRDNPIFYWVVHESNSNFGSRKSMRLEYKDDVDKLIVKNKLELKSNVGRKNKLVIYEVYNKSAFMDKQFRDPTYYKSVEAGKVLNLKPLYVSTNELKDDF